MAVKYKDLIELVPFVQYVQNKSKDYLNHHPYQLNDKPPPGFKIPVSEGKAAATFPDIKWVITEFNCKNNVDKLCNSFINSNSGKIIDASDTLDFILSCFYEVCRIYEYKFSYYTTTSTTSLITKEYFGLKDSYYSVDQKKPEYKGGRTFQEYKTDFIKEYKDCGIYGPIGEKKGNIIYASSVTEIVDKLIEFNKSNEMCEDWGTRNKIVRFGWGKVWQHDLDYNQYTHFLFDHAARGDTEDWSICGKGGQYVRFPEKRIGETVYCGHGGALITSGLNPAFDADIKEMKELELNDEAKITINKIHG